MKFRLQQNTDSVDIDQKCLGVCAWVPGDSVSMLNTNRGLHIQIRHNKNKDTFEAANKLSQLIAASPDLLEFVKRVVNEQLNHGAHGDAYIISEGSALLKKAGA